MLNENILNLLKEKGKIEYPDGIHEDIILYPNEPMKNHTTFHIGGNADCFCEVKNCLTLRHVISLCKENNIPCFIIGLGSNLLVSDSGFRGIVIKLSGDFTEIRVSSDHIICGAGCSLAGLCVAARKHSLSGLEFAWGIPGSVGGATYMNAGAYGGEMKDVVFWAKFMDSDGNIHEYEKDQLDFGYRHSVFTDTDNIILEVGFELKKENPEIISYRMQELMNKRKAKQPVNHYSAGSVFKRPKEDIYAAALIEECGLKGYSVGGAEVSTKHSGFIVNDRNATAEDVKQLIDHIQKTVLEQKGIELCCEIKFVG